jgi:PadR family transcriptional regulator, regulatory protein PadR
MPRRRNPPPTPPSGDGDSPSGVPVPPIGWSPRDVLVPYVLLAVSLQRGHGYWIEEYLRGLGLLGLEMSTLYRTLRQLERDGLLHSSWEPGPSGPARRVYGLTEAGHLWLDGWARALDGYRGLLDRFFGLYTPPAPQP